METLNIDGNKVFIDWVSMDHTMGELDVWVENIIKKLDPEEEITITVDICGKDAVGLNRALNWPVLSTTDELKKIIPPDPNKPCRLRLANVINSITLQYIHYTKLRKSHPLPDPATHTL